MKIIQHHKLTMIIMLAFIGTSLINAQNFRANLDVQPNPSGASLLGSVNFTWPNGALSSLNISNDTKTTIAAIPDLPGSLLAASESTLNANLLFYTFNVYDVQLGLATNFSQENLNEKGNFKDASSTTQVYDNNLIFSNIGPALDLAYNKDISSAFAYSVSLTIVPVFLYSYKQNINIKPLVSTEGTSNQSRIGTPSAKIAFNLSCFSILELGANYNFTSMPFDLLKLNSMANGYELQTSSVQMHDYFLQASFLLNLVDSAKMRIGCTMENGWVIDNSTGKPTTTLADPEFGIILGISVQ